MSTEYIAQFSISIKYIAYRQHELVVAFYAINRFRNSHACDKIENPGVEDWFVDRDSAQ